MKKIFIMNLGTTSFKFKLYSFTNDDYRILASGEIESVGAESGKFDFSLGQERKCGVVSVGDHGEAFQLCLEQMQNAKIISGLQDLNAVGYKAVHGGNLSGTRIVDDELLLEMERVTPLAPAHNPIYLSAMRSIREKYPELIQVARFETSFHNSVPEHRRVYGVPYEWAEEWGIKRYGFHGSSHEYIAGAIAQRAPEAKRVISCHLGGSSSVCAILDGKSIATSMGATPQSGLFQNNRVGDFELFCLPLLLEKYDGDLARVMNVLSKESGFKGLSGVSNDLRQVMDAAEAGNQRAKLAVDAFVDNLVGYIGMFSAYLNGLDVLCFTGGIGTNSVYIRREVCARLGYLGISLDEEKNETGADECVSTGDSRVCVYRLKTDEEIVVARNVLAALD